MALKSFYEDVGVLSGRNIYKFLKNSFILKPFSFLD